MWKFTWKCSDFDINIEARSLEEAEMVLEELYPKTFKEFSYIGCVEIG